MFRRMQYYAYFIIIPKCYDSQTDSFYIDIYTFDGRQFEFIMFMGSKKVEGTSISYQFEIKEINNVIKLNAVNHITDSP